jgi:hypothetical protein
MAQPGQHRAAAPAAPEGRVVKLVPVPREAAPVGSELTTLPAPAGCDFSKPLHVAKVHTERGVNQYTVASSSSPVTVKRSSWPTAVHDHVLRCGPAVPRRRHRTVFQRFGSRELFL